MRRLLLIGILISFYSAASDVAVSYDKELAIKQVKLPLGFSEDKLLNNDALFNDQFINTPVFLSPISRGENDRIIGLDPLIGVINKLPDTDFKRKLLENLNSDLLVTTNSCLAKSKVLSNQFNAGGLCYNGLCVLDEPINSEMVNLTKAFDAACKTNIQPKQEDERLNHTVALFLADKFLCMGHIKDNLLVTARHCFYNDGYVIDMIRNKSIEISNDDESRIKVPVQIQFAQLQDIHNKQTLRMFLPDDTGFDGYDDVIAIFLDTNSNDNVSFASPKESSRSNMVVVNRFLVPSQTQIEQTIREYDKPTCRILAANESCILHTCPTLPSFSGAPLYQKGSNGENNTVGIHVGAYGDYYSQACKDVSARFSFGFESRNTSINVAIPVGIQTNIQKVSAEKI